MFDILKKHKQENFQKHKKSAENAYYNDQDKARAVQELDFALKVKPDCYETWCQYGNWCDALASEYMIKGEMNEFARLQKKAEQAIRKSIEINPQYALGYYRLGNILWGSDFRKALVEFERAAKLDEQYIKDVERARNLVAECTHKLNKQKIVYLKSLKEQPLPSVYETEFYFEDTPIGCLVMHTCVSDTKCQWTHFWIFRSEKPDLFKESPIGGVSISSARDVSVSAGCPGNYTAVLEHLYKNNLL